METIKKYELTDMTINWNGHILHRIKALRDININTYYEIREGTLGGFIESEENLSHEGNCWIADEAKVYDNAIIIENASVCNHAQVFENAKIGGSAHIRDDVQIYGDVKVDFEIHNDHIVLGHNDHGSEITDYSELSGSVTIISCNISGYTKLSGLMRAIKLCFDEDTIIDSFDPSDECIKKLISNGKKYRLTNIHTTFNGKELYLIQSLIDFKPPYYHNIKAGDLGGFIEKEDNLSHEGNCWIAEDAKVYDNAKVFEDAFILSYSEVFDNAQVYGKAYVAGGAKVYGNAKVYGHDSEIFYGSVFDNAQIYDSAYIEGESKIYGNAKVFEDARVFGECKIYENAKIHGDIELYHHKIYGTADLFLDYQLREFK